MPTFDAIGERYDRSFTDRSAQRAAGARVIAELPAGARVLDLGCGSGLPTAKQLLDAHVAVVGVDESQVMLDLAQAQAPGGDYRLGDVRALDDDLGEFDAVVAFFSLLMLPRREIAPVLRRCRELLRGPRLLCLGMVVGDVDALPIEFLGAPAQVSAYPTPELEKVVTDAGFEVLDTVEVRAEPEPGRSETQVFLHSRAN